MRAGLMASRVRRAGGCAGKARSGRSAPRRWPKWAFGSAGLAGGGVGRRGRVRGESRARRGGNGTVLCGRAEDLARPSSPGEQPSSPPLRKSSTWKTRPKTVCWGKCRFRKVWPGRVWRDRDGHAQVEVADEPLARLRELGRVLASTPLKVSTKRHMRMLPRPGCSSVAKTVATSPWRSLCVRWVQPGERSVSDLIYKGCGCGRRHGAASQ